MAAVPLNEYVTILGFKVDQASLRRFSDSVDNVSKTVLKLGAGVAATATAVAVAVVKIGGDFDKLHWMAQRTGSSVTSINAFTFAVSQMGGTVAGAQSSLEGFNRFVLNNPGNGAWIKGLFGIDPAQFKSQADLLAAIGERGRQISERGPMQQTQMVNAFSQMGIDLQTMQAMFRGLGQFEGVYRRTLSSSGVDPDGTSKKSMEFMRETRTVLMQLDVLKTKVFEKLLDKYGPQLDKLVEYLSTHIGEIADKIVSAIDALISFGEGINDMVKATVGWKTVFEGLALIFTVSWLASITAGIVTLGAAFGPIVFALTAISGLILAIYNNADRMPAWIQQLGSSISGAAMLPYSQDARDALVTNVKASAGNLRGLIGSVIGGDSVGGTPAGMDMMKFFVGKDTPYGKLTVDDAAALVVNAFGESSLYAHPMGRHGVPETRASSHKGLWQLDRDNQKEFFNFAGKDLADATREEQWAFMLHQLRYSKSAVMRAMHNTSGAKAEAKVFHDLFEKSGIFMEGERRGEGAPAWVSRYALGAGGSGAGGNAAVTQNNNFHISHPDATGVRQQITPLLNKTAQALGNMQSPTNAAPIATPVQAKP